MQFGERRQRVKATLLNMGVTEAVFEILLDVGGAWTPHPQRFRERFTKARKTVHADSNRLKYR